MFGFHNATNNIADLDRAFKSAVFAHVSEIAKHIDTVIWNLSGCQALRMLLLGTFEIQVRLRTTYAIDV